MEEHKKNIYTLQHMLSILRVRQSAWALTSQEREETKQGIKALQAAVEAMSVQVYA